MNQATKGQIKLKADLCPLHSPKKQTNEQTNKGFFLAMKSKKSKKKSIFVFLGESMANMLTVLSDLNIKTFALSELKKRL